MSIIGKIMSSGRKIADWMLGRRSVSANMPEIVDRYYPPPNQDDPASNHSDWDAEPQEADAIRGIYTPNQSDQQYFNIRPFPQNGVFRHQAEHFIFSDQGMTRVEERRATIMAGNEVASPREIAGICICGRPIRSGKVRFCNFCGAALGPCCGRVQPIPPGVLDFQLSYLVLCPLHRDELRTEWPHWLAASDGDTPVFLPPDMSTSLLDNTQE